MQHSESRNSSLHMGIWTENNTQSIHIVQTSTPERPPIAIGLQSFPPDPEEVSRQ
jgi:hypothetical protein